MDAEILNSRKRKIAAEVEKAYRAYHNEFTKRWRAKNPERAREGVRRWRAANRKSHNLSCKLWKYFNKDRVKSYNAEWYAANKAYHRERYLKLKAEGAFKKGGKYYRPGTGKKNISSPTDANAVHANTIAP